MTDNSAPYLMMTINQYLITKMCTLSILFTTQGPLCSFELLIIRIRHLHDSEQQWASKRVVVNRAILKSNLSLKATLRNCSINSFFSTNNSPTVISSESQLLRKFGATMFEGKIGARLVRGSTFLLDPTIGGIDWLSLLFTRISSSHSSSCWNDRIFEGPAPTSSPALLKWMSLILLEGYEQTLSPSVSSLSQKSFLWYREYRCFNDVVSGNISSPTSFNVMLLGLFLDTSPEVCSCYT